VHFTLTEPSWCQTNDVCDALEELAESTVDAQAKSDTESLCSHMRDYIRLRPP